MLRPRNVQLIFAHSPEPVKTIFSASSERERVEHVVEAGAAGRHLVRRQVLQVHVPARDADARERHQHTEHAVDARNRRRARECSAAARNTKPSAIIATRWRTQSGHTSSPTTCCS